MKSTMICSITIRLFCILHFGLYLVCGCKENPHFKDAGPLAKSNTGSIVGKYIHVFDTDVAAFFGIPYAKCPIGGNRFSKADPIDPWPGMLIADEKPPPCMQYSSQKLSWTPTTKPSENCLFLNIWTPTKWCHGDLEKLPVMVWIHGGGFYSGSTDMDIYDGSTLASYGEAVVVSINYRVGVFGFLYTGDEEAPGNVGLHDQNIALKWIKQNIQYFGGDPKLITLFGESAGSISVTLHMVSPLSRDLFHRAILQSGTFYSPITIDSSKVALFKANKFAQLVGCANGSVNLPNDSHVVVQCLKEKTAIELARAEDAFLSKFPPFFVPSAENEFLPKSPTEAYDSGDFAPVDVLIGNVNNEGTIFVNIAMPEIFPLDQEPILHREQAKSIIPALLKMLPQSVSDEIYDFYFQHLQYNDSAGIAKAIGDVVGDAIFVCPSMFLAEKTRTSYMYWITHRSLEDTTAAWMGVPHFYEVPFVFGKPTIDTKHYTPEDGRFSGDVIQKWVSFARTGYPLDDGGQETWPMFSSSNPVAYELNPRNTNILTFPRKAACEFWRPFFAPSSGVWQQLI